MTVRICKIRREKKRQLIALEFSSLIPINLPMQCKCVGCSSLKQLSSSSI